VVIEASSEPEDIEQDGITVAINDSITVHSPAPDQRNRTRVVKKRRKSRHIEGVTD